MTRVRGPAPVTEEHADQADTKVMRPASPSHEVARSCWTTLLRLEAQMLAGKLQAEGLKVDVRRTSRH